MVSKIYKSSDKMEIDLEDKRNKEAYKVTLNIDIEISTKLKISTKTMKHIGGQYTKLYNNSSLMKLIFYQRS